LALKVALTLAILSVLVAVLFLAIFPVLDSIFVEPPVVEE